MFLLGNGKEMATLKTGLGWWTKFKIEEPLVCRATFGVNSF
jgi:hypothetical protein